MCWYRPDPSCFFGVVLLLVFRLAHSLACALPWPRAVRPRRRGAPEPVADAAGHSVDVSSARRHRPRQRQPDGDLVARRGHGDVGLAVDHFTRIAQPRAHPPTRRVTCSPYVSVNAYRMLIGACHPMLCPIWGLQVLVSTPSKNFTAADYPALAAALGIGSNTTQLLCVARACTWALVPSGWAPLLFMTFRQGMLLFQALSARPTSPFSRLFLPRSPLSFSRVAALSSTRRTRAGAARTRKRGVVVDDACCCRFRVQARAGTQRLRFAAVRPSRGRHSRRGRVRTSATRSTLRSVFEFDRGRLDCCCCCCCCCWACEARVLSFLSFFGRKF